MTYPVSRTLAASFDDAVARVTEAMKSVGFGVLTQIDIARPCRRSWAPVVSPWQSSSDLAAVHTLIGDIADRWTPHRAESV